MDKKIAIVGNAAPFRDYSKEIDTCDLVVRFNNTNHWKSGKIGSRCDIHAFQHNEITALAGGVSSSPAKEIWIFCSNRKNCNALKIIRANNFMTRKCRVVFWDEKSWAVKLCAKYASSGFSMIESLLEKAYYDCYKKLLFCFTWQGCKENHNWRNEKNWCQQYERKSLLKIIR